MDKIQITESRVVRTGYDPACLDQALDIFNQTENALRNLKTTLFNKTKTLHLLDLHLGMFKK